MQVESPADILSAKKLIFPGVGSFGQAMKVLESRGYTKPLLEYINVSTWLAALETHSIKAVTPGQMMCFKPKP
jgi:imidazoleglycerol phosphate synthase glutamine amidotransferase subunit HisH